MTQTAIRPGRQTGSKNKSTLLKANAAEAYGLVTNIMRDQNADPSARIQAASVIIGLQRQQASN